MVRTHCNLQRQHTLQSGQCENGQDDREDLKQDGETTLAATWVLRCQDSSEIVRVRGSCLYRVIETLAENGGKLGGRKMA